MIVSRYQTRPIRPLELTENERAWIEFIRLASHDTDSKPTLERVQQLQKMFRA
jgi:hypothetical protein